MAATRRAVAAGAPGQENSGRRGGTSSISSRVELRRRMDGTVIQVGAEGGIFPGRAFDDAGGEPLPGQYLLDLKLGLLY